ncbi:hypothetical protein FRX31_017234 [Thalictrum thalictroides]|uniref:Uncharacterized protein n=1 Tax=Thalictrum thalictroides TaxID=46969 RepID=A0A7J6W9A7_THATH|nr:hypothetical protein FRX31_017234 [Thalictrum thalictroides]
METNYKNAQEHVLTIAQAWNQSNRDMDNPEVQQAIIFCQTTLQEHDDELRSIAINWSWTKRLIDEVRKSVCNHVNLKYNDGPDSQWYTYECIDCDGITGDDKHFGYGPYNVVGRWD